MRKLRVILSATLLSGVVLLLAACDSHTVREHCHMMWTGAGIYEYEIYDEFRIADAGVREDYCKAWIDQGGGPRLAAGAVNIDTHYVRWIQ